MDLGNEQQMNENLSAAGGGPGGSQNQSNNDGNNGGGNPPSFRSAQDYKMPETESFFDNVGDGARTIYDIYKQFSPLGFVGRGIGSLFDKLGDLRGFNVDGSRRTQEEYEEARQNRITQNRIADIMGRDAPFTQLTLDRLERLGAGPQDPSLIGTTNNMRTINDPIFGDVTRGTIYDAEEPEGILSQAPDYNFRDAMREINLQPGFNARQNLSAATQGIDKSMYGADQDIYGVENARGLFRPSVQSTNFNTKYGPDGITYYDEQPSSLSTALGVRPANNLFADVSQADLMLNNMRGSKLYNLDQYRGFSENPTLTQEELDGIRNKTIKSPTGKFRV